jgi:hypothetical protein
LQRRTACSVLSCDGVFESLGEYRTLANALHKFLDYKTRKRSSGEKGRERETELYEVRELKAAAN